MNAKILSILTTITFLSIGVVLILLLWDLLNWYSLLVILPIIFLEIYFLNKIDNYYIIKKKKELIQKGIISESIEGSKETLEISQFERYKQKVNNSIKNINDLLIDINDIYYEALDMIENGELLVAKRKFQRMLDRIKSDLEEEDIKVIQFTNQIIENADQKLNLSIINFKENWNKTKNAVVKKIKEIAQKFNLRSQIKSQIDKIFQFEIENNRAIKESDLDSIDIPPDQFKRIIRIIERPVKIKLKELNKTKKQKLGEVSKKVIAVCTKNDVSPNLAYLYSALQIDLKKSKEILSYLHEVGMIDVIFYHMV
ncbi:MAG: hypothetical protein GF329_02750 [Candidatus Lokiarchaeota archaeon]|nr:hypothetical protein [Candidatus Lokiarchaeota archaeon]